MMMAIKIKNLQEGKETMIGDGKEEALKETSTRLEKSETENSKLARKLEEVMIEKVKTSETINIPTKVVESVNKNSKEQKTIKNKKDIKCRDFSKATGCSWGDRCQFSHGEEVRLVKESECSYWLEGHLEYTQPSNKRIQAKAGKDSRSGGFLGGPGARVSGTSESFLTAGRRGPGDSNKQEEQENDGGYSSGEGEPAGHPEKPTGCGRANDGNLPQGWRGRARDPSVPHGRRGKPADRAAGTSGTAAAGRGELVKKRKEKSGGGRWSRSSHNLPTNPEP